MTSKKILIVGFLLIGIMLMGTFVFAATSSFFQSTPPGISTTQKFLKGQGADPFPIFNEAMCGKGQDFIVQIAPFGCSPEIVRSDLLEEQNVPVFCQLAATKINPLVDVAGIESISFQGNYPRDVSGVGFYPARAAVKSSSTKLLNSPVLENIGYAVIVLRQNPKESEMPDFVDGNLVATIRYDVEKAFGIGKGTFYLPPLSDEDWQEKYRQYGFWNGKGFLRLDFADVNSAVVSIYTSDNEKISTTSLRKGQTSDKIFLPGFYCQANLKLRLDGLEIPGTRAKLNINGDIVEVSRGEKFLDNLCTLRDIENKGINKRVSIQCRTDSGGETFDLKIIPKIKLEIDGVQREVSVGERLYNEGDKTVYLAYAGTKKDSGKENDLFVILLSSPEDRTRLSDSELSTYNFIGRASTYSQSSGIGVIDATSSAFRGLAGMTARLDQFFRQGKSFEEISISPNTENAFGKNIRILGLSGAKDSTMTVNEKQNYDSAMNDYKEIINKYSNERYPPAQQITLGEEAFSRAIQLSFRTGQNKAATELCKDFTRRYPKSSFYIKECDDSLKISNTENALHGIFVNGKIRDVSIEGIYEPGLDEYSAEIMVTNSKSERQLYVISKNEIIEVGETNGKKETLQLVSLNDDSATLNLNVERRAGVVSQVSNLAISSSNKVLKRGVANNFDSQYTFELTKVNLKKQAKVSVLPGIDNAQTKANITFRIGIEKRGIQLSPDEIKDRISSLKDSIQKWEDTSDTLGNAVRGFNSMCLATGTALTIKGLVENADGKSISRQEVMRTEGGWTDICKDKVSRGEFSSLDACFLANSEAIEKDVNAVQGIIESHEAITDSNLCDRLGSIKQDIGSSITNGQEGNSAKTLEINTDLSSAFTADSANGKCEKISLSRAKDLERLNKIIKESKVSPELKKAIELKRYELLSDINTDVRGFATYNSIQEALKGTGTGLGITSYNVKDAIKGKYSGGTISQDSLSDGSSLILGDKKPAEIVDVQGKQYLVTLNNLRGNEYSIDKAYEYRSIEGGKIVLGGDKTNEVQRLFGTFTKYDVNSYRNKFLNPEVKYFETEPYKGLPAMVPFDTSNGWYVEIRHTTLGGAFGNLASYTDAGQLSSFYICNVGENGKAEGTTGKDEICQQFNPGTGQVVRDFPGLSSADTTNLVRKAMNAVNDASRQYKSGVGNVRILRENIKVGSPAANVPEVQCQDFMSPTECNVLFNVCDPVVCPSSRCDLGGTYQVADVVQSGIVGSTLLCLPNYKEGIYVPVCLSGVKAGLDSLISVQKNYQDCLQANLDTGKTIGICDEIHSIYLCDFFWNQAQPISQLAIPTLFEFITGKTPVRGGGEYLGLNEAWKNAQNSVDYMTQYYGANSFTAFKGKAIETVGKSVCRNFISAAYPSDVGLSSLIEPRSPPQFTAWFSEQTFTTATVPAISQYKVFYHIYAGENTVENIGAYYSVYLKSPLGTSGLQTNPTFTIASGYIAKGNYASETKDFTAPTGYKELCIRVNTQEECGFKQVSTSFSVNYLNDLYLKEQASQTNIQTEAECVSGTPSAYSLINPNVQAGAQEAINPQLYERGITRICATDNPGRNTDAFAGTQRGIWQEVGTCDSGQGKVKCYIDTRTVKDVIRTTSIENQTLSAASTKANEILKDGTYISDFESELKKIELKASGEKISYITSIIGKAIFAHEKAKLLLLRGEAYGGLVSSVIDKIGERCVGDECLIEVPRESIPTPEVKPTPGALPSDTYMQRYENSGYESQFKLELDSNGGAPSGWEKNDFKALMVAIAQQETSLGQGNNCGKTRTDSCSDWLMGYTDGSNYPESYKGSTTQISLASRTLKNALSNPSSGSYSACNSKIGDDKVGCILSVYHSGKPYGKVNVNVLGLFDFGNPKGKAYAENVFNSWQQWRSYFGVATSPLTSDTEDEIDINTFGSNEDLIDIVDYGIFNCDRDKRKLQFCNSDIKFNSNKITYSFFKNFAFLDSCSDEEKDKVRTSLDKFSNDINRVLTFSEVTEKENILIICSTDKVGTLTQKGIKKLTVTGQTRNWIYTIPGNTYLLESAEIELFKMNPSCFEDIFIHEILHVLGFDHITDPESIMSPTSYDCENSSFSIDKEIVDEIKRIYS